MISRFKSWSVGLIIALLAIWTWNLLGIQWDALARGGHNFVIFTGDALPPDWSIWGVAWAGLVETIEIAFLATLIGLALSLPLAVLSAHNLAPMWITAPTRTILAAIRVLPSLLWAILFVIIVGFGPLAGVLAMGLYSVGYLSKLQYEAIEGLPAITLDTADAMGLPKWQKIRYIVLPEAANALLSQALFMFEYNVRASTIIGIVGAGGIGHSLTLYLGVHQYDRVLTLLIMVFFAVLVIDVVSLRVRARFMEDSGTARRPRWRNILAGT